MSKIILLAINLFIATTLQAQKLSFEKLEQLHQATIDEAEEQLFLVGYSFISRKQVQDRDALVYHFSNLKQTIGTAKRISKSVSEKNGQSFIEYVTFDRAEFESLRKLMIQKEFIRKDRNNISENSEFEKEGLRANFKVSTDEYENKTFTLTLQGTRKNLAKESVSKKLSLKKIFRQQED
jgi:hypothetical protein